MSRHLAPLALVLPRIIISAIKDGTAPAGRTMTALYWSVAT
jgi:hypothetical protein